MRHPIRREPATGAAVYDLARDRLPRRNPMGFGLLVLLVAFQQEGLETECGLKNGRGEAFLLGYR